jgi:hypothetical protein
MAIKNSAIYTAQTQAIKGFGSRASAANVSAMLMFATFTYTVDGTETTGDTINFGYLPEGVIVVPALSRVSSGGTGGTGAITEIGDPLDPNRYSATSIAVASAVSTAVTTTNAQAVSPVGVPVGGETITGTLTFASALTVGSKITLSLAYLSVV